MSRYSGSDPYLDGSGVLKNRLGINDEATLEQAEADIVAARSFELSQKPLSGRFDLAHLQAIHQRLFADLYDWAGQLRTIDIKLPYSGPPSPRFTAISRCSLSSCVRTSPRSSKAYNRAV